MGSAAFSCIWLRFLLVYFLGITGFYLVLLSFTKFNLVVLRFSLVTDFYGLLPSFTRFSWMSTVFFARVDCVVPFCGIFWNWIGFYCFFLNWFAIVSRGLGWMVPGFYLVLLGFSSIGERPAALSESFQSVFARHCRIWSALTRRWDSQTSPKKKLFFHSNPFQRLFAFLLSTSPPPASHLRSLSSKQLVLVFFPPRHRLIWNAGTLERWNAHSLADSDRVLLGFTGFYWVLLGFSGFYWVLLGFTGFYWVLLGFTGFYWVLLGFTGFYWVLLGFTGFYRVLPGFTGFYWVLPSFTLFYLVLLGFTGFYLVLQGSSGFYWVWQGFT